MIPKINSLAEYEKEYALSVANPEKFWAEKAAYFQWRKSWDKVLSGDFETASIKWFEGAKLNITENCLDRHLAENGDKIAIIWEANEINQAGLKLTYRELHQRVCAYANVLKNLGVVKGDRVCVYMPMIPDLTIALLACARIGAIHSVVFAGFSAKALADRIKDAECKIVLTSDGMKRGKKQMPVKEIVDQAVENCQCVEHVLVSKHTGESVKFNANRDYWLHEELSKVGDFCPAEEMDAEDLLFILYTSGSTGKPKGVVHTCAGYMVYTNYTFSNVFQYEAEDVFWCTADIGWVTGHSYIVYGPLLAGATTLMFEGIPSYPDASRFWQICEKHKVNQFYTAPTAIRALMKDGTEPVLSSNLENLKVLGSVGEPINNEAWQWYHKYVGKEKTPLVDTWWQTETGGIMLSSIAGITPQKATFAGLPLPGIQPALLDEKGNEIEEPDIEGYLCIKFPWPAILRTTFGDHERCKNTYFANYKGYYFSGDSAKKDKNGLFRVIGRVDDVINVSGHRFGTAEIENAINEHSNVVESAVVAYPHDIKGQGIHAYVICNETPAKEKELFAEIQKIVDSEIGKIARPERIQLVSGLPKTRSGKIMRRILRKVAEGDTSNLGDTSTLLDPNIVEELKQGAEKFNQV